MVVEVVLLVPGAECGVAYDRKGIIINGQKRVLISGSIHYPRSTPEVMICLTFWACLVQLQFNLVKFLMCIVVLFGLDVGRAGAKG